MNRIDQKFKELKKKNKKALTVFITAGFPDIKTTEAVIDTLIDSGIDALELGVPFSDPIADGPTIQYASQKALEKNITLKKILAWVKKKRARIPVPLLLMGYLNPFYQYGMEKFMHSAHTIVDGVIIPDLSLEESEVYRGMFRKNNIKIIQLITPVSPAWRMRKIIRAGEGFLYAVSTTGVTGARTDLPQGTVPFLRTVRALTSLPIAVGIGISHPRQIKKIRSIVDGIIVGSAYIKLIRDYKGKNLLRKIADYTRTLRNALDN